MERLQTIKFYAGQLQLSLEEIAETVNLRDRENRLFEARSYIRQIADLVEREQNEMFRKDPKKGLQRAMLRWNTDSI